MAASELCLAQLDYSHTHTDTQTQTHTNKNGNNFYVNVLSFCNQFAAI